MLSRVQKPRAILISTLMVVFVASHFALFACISMAFRMFPLCLTDNGSEFTDPAAIETSPLTGGRRTRLSYCDPHASWQKGRVENNHLNLRKIFPKGCSFDTFTQADVDLALSHVNSMARRSLNDIPAFKVFESLYGEGVLGKLGLRLVPLGDVNLTPALLGR